MPEPAAQSAGQRVFGGEEQELAAGLQYSCQLPEARSRIGEVLQDPTAHNGVESTIGVGQSCEIGGHLGDALRAEAIAGALEHALRIVERGENRIGVGLTEEETGIAAIATAGVQNMLAPFDVKAAWANEPAGKGLVAGEESGDCGELAREAVVMVLNEAAIIGEGAPLGFFGFQGAGETLGGRRWS